MVLAALFISCYPQQAGAAPEYFLHYIVCDEAGNETWAARSVNVEARRDSEIAYGVFCVLFNDGAVDYLPEDAEVLSARVADGVLYLNVTPGILNYGGTYYETRLAAQLIKTALALPGVQQLSLLIEGSRATLNEGGEIWNAAETADLDVCPSTS